MKDKTNFMCSMKCLGFIFICLLDLIISSFKLWKMLLFHWYNKHVKINDRKPENSWFHFHSPWLVQRSFHSKAATDRVADTAFWWTETKTWIKVSIMMRYIDWFNSITITTTANGHKKQPIWNLKFSQLFLQVHSFAISTK